jgi:hypothetical protein
VSLLKEIETGACSSDVDLAMLLRKCQVFMSRIGNKSAEEWVDHELNGYPDDAPVPAYRVLPVQLKGSFLGAFRKAEDFTIPPALVPKHLRGSIEHLVYRKSVSSIAHLVEGSIAKGDGTLVVPMGNLMLALGKVLKDMQCISAWGEVGTAPMQDILNSVRNRVLKLSIVLQKEHPEAGEVEMDKKAEAQVAQIINNVINYGTAQVIGSAHSSNVTMNVTRGDFASLKQCLVENGLTAEDVAELQSALEQEPEAKRERFGPKVAAWMGKMLQKTASGPDHSHGAGAGSILASISRLITGCLARGAADQHGTRTAYRTCGGYSPTPFNRCGARRR